MSLVVLALARALPTAPLVLRRRRRGGQTGSEDAPEETAAADAAADTGPSGAAAGGSAGVEPGREARPATGPGGSEGEREEAEPGDEGEGATGPEGGRGRLARRLGRTRALFQAPLSAIRSHRRVDESTFEALEEALVLADVGIPTTTRLLDGLREALRTRALGGDPDELLAALRAAIVGLFEGDEAGLRTEAPGPSVWLFVGVNGVGKTTTIGKLAARELAAGRSVVLAGGDTFRAAAGEQLEHWAERSGAGFVRGSDGADPSSVIFDAVQHAAARGVELVLADSAGRLHTRANLMDELRKVRRVADRPPGRVTEVLLVLDATTGQNGLAQAREFTAAVEVTGIVLTKLDGTAKGGIVLAVRSELGLPIKLVGLGEGIDDLVEFDPDEFAAALVG